MSLLFNSTGDVIVHTGNNIDNMYDETWAFWVYLNATPSGCRIFQKGYIGVHSMAHILCIHDEDADGIELNFTGTVDRRVAADPNDFANYGTGKWMFIVGTGDNGTAANNKLFIGDLDSPPAEPSSYHTQSQGSTIHDDSVSDLNIGNRGGNSGNWNGRIAWYACWNKVLTEAQIKQLWMMQRVTEPGCQLFCWPGFHGISSIPDLSGNVNNGTGSNLTIASGVPLGSPFGFDAALSYVVAAVGGLSIPVAMHHYLHNLGK